MGTIKGGVKWQGAKINGNTVNGVVKGGNIIYNKNIKIRYIRDYVAGSTVNGNHHWIELQALDFNSNNMALGKIPTVQSPFHLNTPQSITNGTMNGYAEISNSPTYRQNYIQIDLGATYFIQKLIIHHYYSDNRTYFGTKTEVSEDGINWITLFDSAISGTYVETAQGHVVFINKTLEQGLILDLPLQSDFIDRTGKNTIVAGNANGLPSFVDNSVNFDGTRTLKTNGNLLISDTNKITISFKIKTLQTSVSMVLESSVFSNSYGNFYLTLNEIQNNFFLSDVSVGKPQNITNGNSQINTGVWFNVTIIIDRTVSSPESNKIFIDGIPRFNTNVSLLFNDNFILHPLFIGARSGTDYAFNGQMKNLKIWNRILTQEEINAL